MEPVSKLWSCQTLEDGLIQTQHQGLSKPESTQEAELLAELQAMGWAGISGFMICSSHWQALNKLLGMPQMPSQATQEAGSAQAAPAPSAQASFLHASVNVISYKYYTTQCSRTRRSRPQCKLMARFLQGLPKQHCPECISNMHTSLTIMSLCGLQKQLNQTFSEMRQRHNSFEMRATICLLINKEARSRMILQAMRKMMVCR